MAYRDDFEALQTRHELLEKKLREIQESTRDLELLRSQESDLRKQLEATNAHLADANRTRLPLLETVRIATPCHVSWESMKGDESVRFCGSCEKNVYNVSSMSRAEAERLIFGTEGNVCIRMYKREDGTILTADCPVGVKRRRRRRVATAIAGAGLFAAAAAQAFTANQSTAIQSVAKAARPTVEVGPQVDPEQGQAIQGGIMPPPPQPVHGHVHQGRAVQRTRAIQGQAG